MKQMRSVLSLLLALCLLLGDVALPVLAEEAGADMTAVQPEADGEQVEEDSGEGDIGTSEPVESVDPEDETVPGEQVLEIAAENFTADSEGRPVYEMEKEGAVTVSLSSAAGMLLTVGDAEAVLVTEDPYVFAVSGPCMLMLEEQEPPVEPEAPLELTPASFTPSETDASVLEYAVAEEGEVEILLKNAAGMLLTLGEETVEIPEDPYAFAVTGPCVLVLREKQPEKAVLELSRDVFSAEEKNCFVYAVTEEGTVEVTLRGALDMLLAVGTAEAVMVPEDPFVFDVSGPCLLTLSWPAGSRENPEVLSGWTWNEGDRKTRASLEVQVPAGKTWYLVEGVENAREMQLSEGGWEEGTEDAVFWIERTENGEVTVTLSWPVGSWQNPKELNIGDFEQIETDPPVYVYTVPDAAQTWFTLTGAEGMLVTADGGPVTDVSLFMAAETVTLSWPAGSRQNPHQLIDGEEADITVPEGGCWFVWVGDQAGTLKFTWTENAAWEIWAEEVCYTEGEIPVDEGANLLKITKPVGQARFTAAFLEKPMPVEVAKGKSVVLTGKDGETLTAADYRWETDNGSVAIVSAGKVTAKGGVGAEAIITATHLTDGTVLRYRVMVTTPATRIAIIDDRYSTPEKDFEVNGLTGWIDVTMHEDGEAYAVWELKGKVYPNSEPVYNACQTIIWTSSDPKCATVEDGVVTLLDAGAGKTVTITAMAADGTGKKASVKIKINRTVDSLSFGGQTPAEMAAGKSVKLAADLQVAPAHATNKKVDWWLLDAATGEQTRKIPGLASINTSGVLAADKNAPAGASVTIRAVALDSSGETAEHTVIIRAATTAVELFLEDYDGNAAGKTVDIYLTGGLERTLVLQANNLPEGTGQGWSWTCSDKAIAVTGGRLTVPADRTGKTVTVTATAMDGTGKKASVKLRILQPVEKLELPATEEVAGGKSLKLAAELKILPANATNKKVNWYLVDGVTGELTAKIPGLASINSSGVFAADKKAANETTVTVKCIPADGFRDPEGRNVEAVCQVTIKPITTGVTLTWDNRTDDSGVFVMGSGGPGYMLLRAENTPADAKQDWDWKASSTDVQFEKTENNGVKVTFGPKCAGKSITITATANDGSGKKATLKIKTVQPVESLSWTGTVDDAGEPVIVVGQGKSQKLTSLVTVDTLTATNKKLDWVLLERTEDGSFKEVSATVANVKNGTLKAVKVPKVMEAYVQVKPADGCLSPSGEPLCKPLLIRVTLYPMAVSRVAIIDDRYSTPEKDFEVNGKTGWIEVTEHEDGGVYAVWELRGKIYPNGGDPAAGACQTILWTSSNEEWARVDAQGNVTLYGAGIGKTVTITASSIDGSGKKASVKIKIMAES